MVNVNKSAGDCNVSDSTAQTGQIALLREGVLVPFAPSTEKGRIGDLSLQTHSRTKRGRYFSASNLSVLRQANGCIYRHGDREPRVGALRAEASDQFSCHIALNGAGEQAYV